jgi:Fic family protein
MLLTNKTYKKICLYCRKEFDAQKRTTKYCSHTCNSRAYKANKRNELDLEINFEDFVKRQLQHQAELLNQIQITLSKLLNQQMTDSEKYLSPDEYCKLKGISRKTLSRVIKEDKVIVKKISQRKILIKSEI